MLLNSIFSFIYNIFHSFEENYHYWIIKLFSANSFKLDKYQKLAIWSQFKSLLNKKRFRFVWLETICRQQILHEPKCIVFT